MKSIIHPANLLPWAGLSMSRWVNSRLDKLVLSVNCFVMQTNVSTLLREFPKVKRAALRGERVLIKTREGNLVLTAECPPDRNILGSMRGTFKETAADLTVPTLPDCAWNASL